MTAAEETKPAPERWRIGPTIWLEQCDPYRDEAERWETPIFGPHACHVALTRMPSGQWGASFNRSSWAYGYDVVDVLEEARLKAIDSSRYMVQRLQHIEIWAE